MDREQIRQDAQFQASHRGSYPEAHLGKTILDLLGLLEQAERERDEWKDACKDYEEQYLKQRARLAKVPALVEALKRIEHYPFAVTSNDQSDLRDVKDIAHDALTAWEAD